TGNASGKPGYVKVFHLGDEANALLLRVPTLQSGQQRILKVMNKLTAVLGDIELIAVIDPDNDTLEQDETNNSRQMHYTGGQAQVDVAVTQIAVSPDSVSENSTFNAVVTVENTGSETADAGYLQIYLDGNPIGKASRVSRLNQGASKAVRMTRLPANVLMGQHIVAAMVDCHKTLTEVNELNNSLQTNLTVTEAPKPDLVITNIELSPAYPIPGESFSAYVWLQNVGKADSKDGYLDIWVDGDANGVPAQSIKLPLLTAGSEAVRTTISRLNSPGIIAEQLLIAIADADNEVLEEDEDNNYAELAYPNPLALYYPLNDGDWKTYTHSARIDADLNVAQSSTQRSVFNETKTIEGQQSIAMMGYDSGNLVSFGVYSEGQIIKFSTPMVLATAEQLSDGGVSQSSTSLTIQGIRVTLATESTVTVVPSVITPLGTFENCRELTYEARASAYGQDQGVLMANAAYYAPNTGPVKMKVVQMDQYGNMDFLYYMEITAGNVNGIPVLAP
ncbi:MAG: hypothetical protein PF904_20145, partial [Kiritimatiellae bacterium]|nr:hypothetical protein [Kiritimatiellia bacterium]